MIFAILICVLNLAFIDEFVDFISQFFVEVLHRFDFSNCQRFDTLIVIIDGLVSTPLSRLTRLKKLRPLLHGKPLGIVLEYLVFQIGYF